MTFDQLLARLLREITRRIENGELTERGLARLCRLSQPHVHHILKGKRGITPQVADLFLDVLGMQAEQLIEDPWAERKDRAEFADPQHCILLPLMEGLVGPGYPPPVLRPGGLYFPFPSALLDLQSQASTYESSRGSRYAVARMGDDPMLRMWAGESDLLVISGPTQESSLRPVTGEAGIWLFEGSWIFDGGHLRSSGDPGADAPVAKRTRDLRELGSRVAVVHWLVRRLRATVLPTMVPEGGNEPDAG